MKKVNKISKPEMVELVKFNPEIFTRKAPIYQKNRVESMHIVKGSASYFYIEVISVFLGSRYVCRPIRKNNRLGAPISWPGKFGLLTKSEAEEKTGAKINF